MHIIVNVNYLYVTDIKHFYSMVLKGMYDACITSIDANINTNVYCTD